MGRHLTAAERAGLAALLADAGPQEVLGAVAQWTATSVADFATADRLATELRRIGRDLGKLEVAREGEPATELATCDTCHQRIRWIPGVLAPPEGAPQPSRVCRRCTEAREQAKREGHPVTIYRHDRALVTFFPDGTSAGSSARLRERRQTDPGLVERRLRRLRKTLSYMEAILLQQGDKADDERVRRAHLVRDEIARNVALLDEINAELPDDAPVGVGDVVPSPHGYFLVGRVNHRTFTGWVVGGGSDAWPGRLDKTKWNGKVTVRANEKLRAAVEHRTKLGGYYGDEKWRQLTSEGVAKKG
jgi:hypothetical protein